MKGLTDTECQWIGAASTIKTITNGDNPHWYCECSCYNPDQEKFFDESDDTFLWWLLSRPYAAMTSIYRFLRS